jgi:hypothetical protein
MLPFLAQRQLVEPGMRDSRRIIYGVNPQSEGARPAIACCSPPRPNGSPASLMPTPRTHLSRTRVNGSSL